MKIKKLIKHQRGHLVSSVNKKSKVFLKPVRKFGRKAEKLALTEVGLAYHLGLKFSRKQLKKRPRIRLVILAMFVLAIFYLASGRAIAYIKPKESEIKINGQPVIADKIEPNKPVPSELEQNITPKLSPFKFREPVADGIISQGYSSYHRANDIAAPFGSPIHPLGPGAVVFAGMMEDGHGNTVIVDHGDGLKTLYAHMNTILVAVGNQVREDTEIGTIGLTGHTTGPHVHIEVFNDGVQIDPASVLPDQTSF